MKNDKVIVLVKKTSLLFEKYVNQLLAPFDLTSSQCKILMVLYEAPNASLRQADIEEEFSLTSPTVIGLVQQLEKKDLVMRIPNPADKRSKLLTLTPHALEIKEGLQAMAEVLESQMTAALTETEHAQLSMLLDKIFTSFRNQT